MAIVTVTTVLPIGGTGTYTIVDTTAAAIAAQTLALEKLFGPLGVTGVNAGGLTSQAARTANNTRDLLDRMDTLTGKFNEITSAIAKLNKGQDQMLEAMAAAHLLATDTKVIQTMTFAATVDNNKFQQKATNAALREAGKPEIKVEPEDLKAETLKMVETVSTINAQVSATSLVLDTISSYASKGLTLAQGWIAQSEVGKFFKDYFAVAKIQVQLLWAEEKLAIELRAKQKDIIDARLSPTTAKVV